MGDVKVRTVFTLCYGQIPLLRHVCNQVFEQKLSRRTGLRLFLLKILSQTKSRTRSHEWNLDIKI